MVDHTIISNLTPQYAKIPCEANEINGSRGIVVFHEHRTKLEAINN